MHKRVRTHTGTIQGNKPMSGNQSISDSAMVSSAVNLDDIMVQ